MKTARGPRPLLVATALTVALGGMLPGCGGVPSAAPPPGPSPAPAPSAMVPSVAATTPVPSRDTARVPSPAPSPAPDAKPKPKPAGRSCAELAGSLSRAQRVGQLFMVGVDTRAGVGRSQAAMMAAQHVGSAVLLGNTTAGTTGVRRLARTVRQTGADLPEVRLMVAADQEGGRVQRLQGAGFDRIPSAVDQARQSNSHLRAHAEIWGRQLKRAGVDADLAPVADVVPTKLRNVNQPIGVLRRGYGADPKVVAHKVSAFTKGMRAAGVVTSVKHFPGLGRVRGNTDFQRRVVDRTTTRHDPALAGFRAAVDSGADMVMMSSAYYAKIDAARPAAFSSTVVRRMVRGDLGFTGVVVSDDLAAEAVRYLSPGQRALRFLRAGGDLMIVGDPSLLPGMAAAVRREARSDPKFAAAVVQHTTRVLQMKARHRLTQCR